METIEKLSLIYPKESPKMSRIFAALEKGYPGAKINTGKYDRFVLWGLIGNNVEYIRCGVPFIFCDMPYHGRLDTTKQLTEEDYDKSFWRWCVGGLHNNFEHNFPKDRFDRWGVDLKEWKKDGEHILLCPSSETMTRFAHSQSVEQWIESTTKEIRKHTKRPIRVRLKPRGKGTSGPSVARVPIEEDLKNAWCVVSSASLASIDALIEGVPVFSTSPHNPAAWVAEQDLNKIETPKYTDRESLFRNLAAKQFSIEEMRNGEMYEYIQRHYPN